MFEPRITAFLCKWCSYAGADLAGTSRMEYPPNSVTLRVMCSSRVDAEHVLHAFRCCADGVVICGCFPGECHYQTGNYRTIARASLLKRTLPTLGIENQRFRVEWVCASCARKYVDVLSEFVEELRRLGPLGVVPARPKMLQKMQAFRDMEARSDMTSRQFAVHTELVAKEKSNVR